MPSNNREVGNKIGVFEESNFNREGAKVGMLAPCLVVDYADGIASGTDKSVPSTGYLSGNITGGTTVYPNVTYAYPTQVNFLNVGGTSFTIGTVTGTDAYGRAQTEVLNTSVGNSAATSVNSNYAWKTIDKITYSAVVGASSKIRAGAYFYDAGAADSRVSIPLRYAKSGGVYLGSPYAILLKATYSDVALTTVDDTANCDLVYNATSDLTFVQFNPSMVTASRFMVVYLVDPSMTTATR